jgi:hypothetical protein
VTIAGYQKFVVALVGFGVIVAHQAGVEVAEDISVALISLLTAVGVFFFRNA